MNTQIFNNNPANSFQIRCTSSPGKQKLKIIRSGWLILQNCFFFSDSQNEICGLVADSSRQKVASLAVSIRCKQKFPQNTNPLSKVIFLVHSQIIVQNSNALSNKKAMFAKLYTSTICIFATK